LKSAVYTSDKIVWNDFEQPKAGPKGGPHGCGE